MSNVIYVCVCACVCIYIHSSAKMQSIVFCVLSLSEMMDCSSALFKSISPECYITAVI